MSTPSRERDRPSAAATAPPGIPDQRAPSPGGTGRSRKGKLTRELWGSLGEEFRSLRTKVSAAFAEQRGKTVLVTSAVPREGKTTVSSHQARSFGHVGRRVLLMDCDLRFPDLHALFQTERAPGMSEVLRGTVTVEDALVPSEDPGFDLLTAGAPLEACGHISRAGRMWGQPPSAVHPLHRRGVPAPTSTFQRGSREREMD